MRPLAPVWNAAERRLRAPLRIVLTVVVVGLVTGGAALLVESLGLSTAAGPVGLVVGAGLTTVAVGVGVGLAALVLDRRHVRDYGLDLGLAWALDLTFGFLVGAVLMSGILALFLGAGWATVTGTTRVAGGGSFPAAFALTVVGFVLVAVGEELAVRGYLLSNLAEGLRALGDRAAVGLAVLGSSTVFGVLHAANPNATPVSVATIALGGVMLGLGFVLTGRLALPVGLHLSWNLFQGSVYGFPVSGVDLGVSAVALSVSGPTVLTGGAFGPEAGLTGVLAIAVGTGLIVLYARVGQTPESPEWLLAPDLRWWAWGRDDRSRTARVDDAPDESPHDR